MRYVGYNLVTWSKSQFRKTSPRNAPLRGQRDVRQGRRRRSMPDCFFKQLSSLIQIRRDRRTHPPLTVNQRFVGFFHKIKNNYSIISTCNSFFVAMEFQRCLMQEANSKGFIHKQKGAFCISKVYRKRRTTRQVPKCFPPLQQKIPFA